MAKLIFTSGIGALQKVGEKELILDLGSFSKTSDAFLLSEGDYIRNLLRANGALLIRGCLIQGSKKLETILCRIFQGQLIDYLYRSTPRTRLRGKIYTSSEYHADQTISLHNENSYANKWPLNIAFYCVKRSDTGGSTPIVDSREVYNNIPIAIREEFEERKIMYVRRYSNIDLPWTEVFQTSSKKEVETFCDTNCIDFEWLGEDGLKTTQINLASCIHPITKENVWFNQAHLFHASSLNLPPDDIPGDLPRNAYYGDGGDIDINVLKCIRNIYKDHMITFEWQDGDLLLLDNMLFAHGREPYTGSRRILVGMANSISAGSLGIGPQMVQ